MDDLEALLNLDGEVFPLDNGYWVKFEARRVEASKAIPHGIKYSLTLHGKNNERIVGYDNAHSFKTVKKYSARKETWDHIHKQKVVSYEFETASQLIEDFWRSVEPYLG
jgi:hypothetical protein